MVTKGNWNGSEYTPEVLLVIAGRTIALSHKTFLPLTDKNHGLDEEWVRLFFLIKENHGIDFLAHFMLLNCYLKKDQ